MENNILLHRRAVQQNIMKSFDSDFESFDEFEKGKWNVGDQKFFNGNMHYVAELKPDGSPRWRRVKKTSGGSGDTSSQNSATSSSDKPSDVKQDSGKTTDKKLSPGDITRLVNKDMLDKDIIKLAKKMPDRGPAKRQFVLRELLKRKGLDESKIEVETKRGLNHDVDVWKWNGYEIFSSTIYNSGDDLKRSRGFYPEAVKRLLTVAYTDKSTSGGKPKQDSVSDKVSTEKQTPVSSAKQTSVASAPKKDDKNKGSDSSKQTSSKPKKKNEIDEVAEGFDSMYRMMDEMKNLRKKLKSDSVSFFKNLGFTLLDKEAVNDITDVFLKKIRPNDLNDCEVRIKPQFEINVWDELSSGLRISVKNNSGNVVFDAEIDNGRQKSSNGLKKIMNLTQELVSSKDFFKTLLSIKSDFNGNVDNEFDRLSNFVKKKKSGDKKSTKKDVWNMTDSDLIKEFKIPRAVLHHHTTKGPKIWHDGESSSYSKDFLNSFRRAVEKYGNPVEFKKESYSDKDQRSYDHSRRNGIEYDWVEGEKIEAKFKTKDGKNVTIDNYDFF